MHDLTYYIHVFGKEYTVSYMYMYSICMILVCIYNPGFVFSDDPRTVPQLSTSSHDVGEDRGLSCPGAGGNGPSSNGEVTTGHVCDVSSKKAHATIQPHDREPLMYSQSPI